MVPSLAEWGGSIVLSPERSWKPPNERLGTGLKKSGGSATPARAVRNRGRAKGSSLHETPACEACGQGEYENHRWDLTARPGKSLKLKSMPRKNRSSKKGSFSLLYSPSRSASKGLSTGGT